MTSPTVTIPFKERFAELLLNGTKNMTTRTRRMANPGDIFHAFGAEFKVVAVDILPLGRIAQEDWQAEGASSPDDFKKIWAEIHPIKGFDAQQKVYRHSFFLLAREE